MEKVALFLASYGLTLSVENGKAVITGEYQSVHRIILLLEMMRNEVADGKKAQDERGG